MKATVFGITAAERHGPGLAVGNTDQHRLVIDLAVNSSGVLLLVAALWLVRQRGLAVPETTMKAAGHPVVAEETT